MLPWANIMKFCLQGQQKLCFKPQMWFMFRKKALSYLSIVSVHWNSQDLFEEVHLTIGDCEMVVQGVCRSSCVSSFTGTLGDVQNHRGALFNFQRTSNLWLKAWILSDWIILKAKIMLLQNSSIFIRQCLPWRKPFTEARKENSLKPDLQHEVSIVR